MKSLRRADLLRTVTLCVAATILVTVGGEITPTSVTRAEFWARAYDLSLTAAWWLAFSVSLYWSEMNKYASNPTEAIA